MAGVLKLRRGDSFAVVRLCGNVSQRQQKGGGDVRLYSESMSELASSKMIIDAGSSDKIASTEIVDQLGLKTEPNPEPFSYRIRPKKKGMSSGPYQKKGAKVSIVLGKFKQDVWCDVVPMDVNNILLGRPW